jgi:hypothetical protein
VSFSYIVIEDSGHGLGEHCQEETKTICWVYLLFARQSGKSQIKLV